MIPRISKVVLCVVLCCLSLSSCGNETYVKELDEGFDDIIEAPKTTTTTITTTTKSKASSSVEVVTVSTMQTTTTTTTTMVEKEKTPNIQYYVSDEAITQLLVFYEDSNPSLFLDFEYSDVLFDRFVKTMFAVPEKYYQQVCDSYIEKYGSNIKMSRNDLFFMRADGSALRYKKLFNADGTYSSKEVLSLKIDTIRGLSSLSVSAFEEALETCMQEGYFTKDDIQAFANNKGMSYEEVCESFKRLCCTYCYTSLSLEDYELILSRIDS